MENTITVPKRDLYVLIDSILNQYYTTDAEHLDIATINQARSLMRMLLDSEPIHTINCDKCTDKNDKVDKISKISDAVNTDVNHNLCNSNESLFELLEYMFNSYLRKCMELYGTPEKREYMTEYRNTHSILSYQTFNDHTEFEFRIMYKDRPDILINPGLGQKITNDTDGLVIMVYPYRKELYISEEHGTDAYSIYFTSFDALFKYLVMFMVDTLVPAPFVWHNIDTYHFQFDGNIKDVVNYITEKYKENVGVYPEIEKI